MVEDDIFSSITVPFTFERRATAIPGDLRPMWRIAVTILLVNKCYGGRASMRQLHVLNWAARNAQTRSDFLSVLREDLFPGAIIIRYEPSLNRAVDFAIAGGLLHREGGDTVALTDRGRDVADVLLDSEGMLVEEKQFLAEIPKKISQKLIDKIYSPMGRG